MRTGKQCEQKKEKRKKEGKELERTRLRVLFFSILIILYSILFFSILFLGRNSLFLLHFLHSAVIARYGRDMGAVWARLLCLDRAT